MIQHARANDLYTNLITGGTLLDEDKLRRFREAGLDHIQLSIQGAARESAEMIAGVRSHRKKLEVARLIRKIGFPLTLNVVIHRLNIAEVPELIALALELGSGSSRAGEYPVLCVGGGESPRADADARAI